MFRNVSNTVPNNTPSRYNPDQREGDWLYIDIEENTFKSPKIREMLSDKSDNLSDFSDKIRLII